MDFCIDVIMPLLLIIAFFLTIIVAICFILDVISRIRDLKKIDNSCNEDEEHNDEYDDQEDNETIQRAIIIIGDEKIEVEVVYHEFDDNTVEIESKDGKVYITDIKNVLLISE